MREEKGIKKFEKEEGYLNQSKSSYYKTKGKNKQVIF